jgi:cytochrome c-type biogenesis protein CcmF
VGLHASLWGDLYVVLGEEQAGGTAWAVTVAIHPLVRWIWAGAGLMALGGVLSLLDRRFRVGAPRPARARRPGSSASQGGTGEAA